jgi:CAI-1 autoinducer synthase
MSAVFLTSGNPQAELESRFAAFARAEATVMFQSGYQANTGLIQTIAEAGTPVYLDQMAHASLYQGVMAAGADLRPFRHNDIGHLQRQVMGHGAGVIAIDSVYSTDGSLAPIQDVLQVAERTGCLLVVDESHSLGTHGPRGAGLVVDLGLEERIQFRTASLAKAFCGRAGLVACPSRFAHYLRFSSFPSIFSSAVLPHELAGFAKTLEIVQYEDWRRSKLHNNARQLRAELDALGYNVSASGSQIISLEAGTEARIVTLADALQSHGVFGAPFFAPATAKNRACIRLSVHAGLDEKDIRRIAEVCAEIREQTDLANWSSTRRKRTQGGRGSDVRSYGTTSVLRSLDEAMAA